MDDGDDKLKQGLDRLEEDLPSWAARALQFLRSPRARWFRLPVGILLILGSFAWFLPALGLWMLPVGLVLVAQDVPFLRRPTGLFLLWLHDRLEAIRAWWRRRRA